MPFRGSWRSASGQRRLGKGRQRPERRAEPLGRCVRDGQPQRGLPSVPRRPRDALHPLRAARLRPPPPPTPAGSASARRSTTSWRPTRSAAPCAASASAAASGTLPSPMGSSARRTCSPCPTGPGPSCATVSPSSRSVVTRVTRTGYAWHGSSSSSSATGMPGRLGCSRARARCECLAFSRPPPLRHHHPSLPLPAAQLPLCPASCQPPCHASLCGWASC